MPTFYFGTNLATKHQDGRGYMGIVIDKDSGDTDLDINFTMLCGLLYEPVNLRGYASRV